MESAISVSYTHLDVYKRQAGTWVEALPVDNSRMGAMVYGGTAREELQLNDEDVYKRQG